MTDHTVAAGELLLPPAYRNRAVLRPKEVFEVLGIGPALGWRLIRDGVLPRIQLGRRSVGVPRVAVERLIERGVPTPEPEPPPAPRPVITRPGGRRS